jgi:hypothetical protein
MRPPDSDPAKKSWSRPYRFSGVPEYVPLYCPRCGEHEFDVLFGSNNQGMCKDCRAISHMLSQRKHRGAPL